MRLDNPPELRRVGGLDAGALAAGVDFAAGGNFTSGACGEASSAAGGPTGFSIGGSAAGPRTTAVSLLAPVGREPASCDDFDNGPLRGPEVRPIVMDLGLLRSGLTDSRTAAGADVAVEAAAGSAG